MGSDFFITLGAAFLAAISFAAFAYPFLQRSDQKERYQSVIEKRRKDLSKQSRENMNKKVKADDLLSAKDSIAMFYKVQQLAGEMGEKARSKMLQAGYRNPSAPIKYMVSKILVPFVFTGIAMMLIVMSKAELSGGITFLIVAASALAGFKLPDLLVKNQTQKRQQDINLAFPDALDMMLICVQGGIGLEQTVDRVAEEISGHSETLAEELGILSAEMAMLNDRRQALQDFARRVGSGAGRNFATALIQAEQYGTSVSQAMKVMSDDLRDQRMALAEQKAASLPPKLTVPMILFFLPALFIVILAPAGIQAFAQGVGG